MSSNYFGPPPNDCAVCQLSPVIVTFCQLPIFDLGSQKSLQSPLLCLCCSLGSFMTILMQFSKIKCIFYDSFRESAPLGPEREREQCRPVSLYDCLSFLLSIMSVFAFIFALIFISFICSSSASSCSLLFVRSACVSKFIFLFVSTVNMMCLWHVLTVSSWRGYRRGYWRFMLTFFLLYRISTIPWVSSLLTHLCLGKRPLTVFVLF